MVESYTLTFENLTDALRHVVQASGGSKAVGPLLFPHIEDPCTAARYLLDHLNPERREKLSLEQLLFLLKVGHRHGCHSGIEYLCEQVGYTKPAPIEPEQGRVDAVKRLQQSITLLRQDLSRLDPGLAAKL